MGGEHVCPGVATVANHSGRVLKWWENSHKKKRKKKTGGQGDTVGRGSESKVATSCRLRLRCLGLVSEIKRTVVCGRGGRRVRILPKQPPERALRVQRAPSWPNAKPSVLELRGRQAPLARRPGPACSRFLVVHDQLGNRTLYGSGRYLFFFFGFFFSLNFLTSKKFEVSYLLICNK